MKKCVLIVAIAMIVGQGFAVIALEPADLNPAPWRTDPIGIAPTTYQSWSFYKPDNPALPDVDLNPYGTAVLDVVGSFDNVEFYPDYQGHQGVWSFEDEILVTIPNNPVQNPFKEMWIQLLYTADEGNAPIIYALPEGSVPLYEVMDLVGVMELPDGWYHATYHVVLEPNPSMELTIVRPFDCELLLDNIIIETICVPEPATLMLLGLGGLTLLRKRSV